MEIPFLGCPHKHLSFPQMTREERLRDGESAQPHVTCLECGKEFWYDWDRMRRAAERPAAAYVSSRRGLDTDTQAA